MPIFQDDNGMAVKFFIQKDLPQEVQAELCETITSLGGRAEVKVPRQGYILVQPGSPEAERLRSCWASLDRPERYFVPYTYVEACKIAGMLLKQIFLEDGSPMPMHIHPSIANVNVRSALSSRIMHSGGDPYASAQSAKVILADPNTEVFSHLVKTYQGVVDKYIESYLWVKKCIEKSAVVYTPLVYKNPGGRRAGEERTQFTEEDEQHLVNWIAAKIPYKETGGRTGNRLYQQLCDLSHDPEYAWVTRHTWQSWRERYKKNSLRLDAIIAQIVDQKKPALGEKGQYGYVRQLEEKPKRTRRKKPKDQVIPDDDFVNPPSGMLLPAESSSLGDVAGTAFASSSHTPAGLDSHGPISTYSAVLSVPPLPPHQRVGKSPAEEEMDDAEDPEWSVRIGNAPPPSWSKKRRLEDPNEDVGKRPRLAGDGDPQHTSHETDPLAAETVVTIANLHVIDQAIRDISKEFKFNSDQVQEYYDKCGDMGVTRAHFQRIREDLEVPPVAESS